MQVNQEFKTKLFNQIGAAGSERSLLPFSDTSFDESVTQLEDINPVSQWNSNNQTHCRDYQHFRFGN